VCSLEQNPCVAGRIIGVEKGGPWDPLESLISLGMPVVLGKREGREEVNQQKVLSSKRGKRGRGRGLIPRVEQGLGQERS